MSLNRNDILKSKVQSIKVEIPEWGGSVNVRAPSSRSRMDLLDIVHANEREIEDYEHDQLLPEDESKGLKSPHRYELAYLELIFAIVDDEDQRLFTIDDYNDLLDLNYPTIQHLYMMMKSLEKRPTTATTVKKKLPTRR
jgi:hypothetical protein